jgi:hypothetical protein
VALQAGRLDPLAGQLQLLLAQRDARHAAPRAPHQLQRQAAPPKPNLQHVVVGFDVRLPEGDENGGSRAGTPQTAQCLNRGSESRLGRPASSLYGTADAWIAVLNGPNNGLGFPVIISFKPDPESAGARHCSFRPEPTYAGPRHCSSALLPKSLTAK